MEVFADLMYVPLFVAWIFTAVKGWQDWAMYLPLALAALVVMGEAKPVGAVSWVLVWAILFFNYMKRLDFEAKGDEPDTLPF